MSKMACEMLTDIEKDTIDWDPNFDETKKEPHVLPSRFPNLLVNGSQGYCRRHGDEHPAPQPARDRQRHGRP